MIFIQIGLKYDLSIISKDLNKISKTIKSHNDSFFRFFKPSYIKQLKTLKNIIKILKTLKKPKNTKKAKKDKDDIVDGETKKE